MAVMSDGNRIGGALPRGPHKLTREQVDADQRARLIESMILETADHGFAASTVAQLITRAQVSRKTFYAHFSSREELLLAAFNTASTWTLEQTEKASKRTGGSTRRLEAAIRKLARCAAESPGAIELCAIEIAAANHTGFAQRQVLMDSTGELIEDCLTTEHQPAALPPHLSATVAGAIHRILDARLRAGQTEALTTTGLELARWVRSYHPAPATLLAPDHTSNRPTWPTDNGFYGGRAPGTLALTPTDYKAPTGRQSRGYLAHTYRERILDAVAQLTAEHGYTELTAQSIAAAADVPERAFLAQFSGKDDAFSTAVELGHTKAQAVVARARENAPTWRIGVQNAVTGLLDFLASEPLYTNMAFIAAPLAGPKMATRHNEQALNYAQLLFHGAPQRRRPPAITAEAISHGLFELAYAYAANDRVAQLPTTAVQSTYLALAPYLGVADAARYATGSSPDTV